MAVRLVVAFGLGLVTTFALFWIMQALIGVTGELEEGGSPPTVDFVRLRKDNAPQVKEREPPKREKPDQPPPPPEMNVAKNIDPGAAVSEVVPMVDTAAEVQQATALGAGGGSRSAQPLVRVEPEYPPRARQRGIRGWVVVEFTITPAGTVQDPKVLDSSPPGVFEQTTLRAVRRWRYNPMIVDGKPVSRTERIKLTFKPPRA